MDIIFVVYYIIIFLMMLFIITIPIRIAKYRGISESKLKIITILSWLTLLFFIPWFIALALSLIYQPEKAINKSSDFCKLEKLYNLKEKGAITQKEYEDLKSKILETASK